MSQVPYPKIRRVRRRRNTLRWIFAGGALVSFLFACLLALVAIPLTMQLVPPRYIARFVPAPLQSLFQPAHTDLPTPESLVAQPPLAALLLTPISTPISVQQPSPTVPAQPTATVPAATATATPTSTPTQVALPTPTFTPAAFPGAVQEARNTPAALGSATVLLPGFRQVYQTWNNCGPANMTMELSHFGWEGTQANAAAFLKPDPEDRNVRPDEMAAFAESQGFRAIVRVNGSLDLLKALLRAGLSPIVEKGFEPEAKLGWMGHYETLTGWSDSASQFITMDSYLGPNLAVSFDDMDKYWRQFNRLYIVVYKPEQAAALAQVIGADMDDTTMYHNALARTQAELVANEQDPFGWFNLGTDYEALQMHGEAVAAYDRARQIGLPWRMTWYQFGWFDAYLAAGRYDDIIALADTTIKSDPYAEEMYYYKGMALQKRGDIQAAQQQLELAVKHNPNYAQAKQALEALKTNG